MLGDSQESVSTEARDVLRQFLLHGANNNVKNLATQAIVNDWTSKS
jgi:hypothetical protein